MKTSPENRIINPDEAYAHGSEHAERKMHECKRRSLEGRNGRPQSCGRITGKGGMPDDAQYLLSHVFNATLRMGGYASCQQRRTRADIILRYVVPDWQNDFRVSAFAGDKTIKFPLGPVFCEERWTENYDPVTGVR